MNSPKKGTKEVIKVRLLRGGKVIRSYKLRSDTFTIGSEKGCTIRAAGDTSLAPKHATIYVEDGELTLVPEPGAEVFLNGESVDFAVPNPDDIIKAGRLTFRVELAESLESLAPPSAKAAPKAKAAVPKAEAAVPKAKAAVPKAKAAVPVQVAPHDRVTTAPKKRASQVVQKPIPSKQPTIPPSLPTELEPDNDDEITDRISQPPPQKQPKEKIEKKDSPSMISPVQQAKISEAPSTVREESDVDVSFEPDIDEGYYFDNEDDENDEFTFTEPFDLADLLLERKEVSHQGPKEDYCTGQVIRVVNGRVVEASSVLPGKPYIAHSGELKCQIKQDSLILDAQSGLSGQVHQAGQQIDLASLPESRGMQSATLQEGDFAQFKGSQGSYKIEVYRPPLAPVEKRFNFSSRFIRIILFAVILHAVVSVAIAYVQPKIQKKAAGKAEEVFAEVKMDKPETEQFKEEVVEEIPHKNAKDMAEKAVTVSTKTIKRRIKNRPSASETSSVSSLLRVLSKGSGKAGASNKLKDLVSNIDAVASGGAGSSFNIAGAIASLPGQGINIARKGGGGAISTLSGDQVAGKGTGIGTLAKGKKRGKVRGKVTKMSSGVKVKGRLSKADVTRVINSHIHAIQACYERALINKPSMSGRIVFDWTVTKSGRVKGVRVRSSTLGSPKVAGCISKQIKRWKFPKPEGGDVTITYPFLFRSVSS